MKSTFFITGTDTSVGKTLVTTALLYSAQQLGKTAFGLKPIAAGCEQTASGLRNDDALAIAAYNGVALPYAQLNPVALAAAKAPHIAAAEEGKRLNLARIEGICRGALMHKADLRLIEGAGGWRIPLNASEEYAELARNLGTPVILVVAMRLGCLNHALLTAQAIAADGLRLAGWVANCVDPHMDSLQANIDTLRSCLPAPLLGVIPWQAEPSVEFSSSCLDIMPLLNERHLV